MRRSAHHDRTYSEGVPFSMVNITLSESVVVVSVSWIAIAFNSRRFFKLVDTWDLNKYFIYVQVSSLLL